MADIVVTLPKKLGRAWVLEGDAAGEQWSGRFYEFSLGSRPEILIGERVYVTFKNKLIGFSPLSYLSHQETTDGKTRYLLIRAGNAQAVTIDQPVPSRQGFRYRFWRYAEEYAFPEWKEFVLNG